VSNPTPATQSPLAPTTLEAETRLILAGVGALHAGDAAHALALFEEHARLFPTGALAEERAAEQVVALGDLRRCDEAHAAAATFLRSHPNSPLSARVRAACVSTLNP
jgi:outer membrane protein assembly factor BamD (BamD/ComL family)